MWPFISTKSLMLVSETFGCRVWTGWFVRYMNSSFRCPTEMRRCGRTVLGKKLNDESQVVSAGTDFTPNLSDHRVSEFRKSETVCLSAMWATTMDESPEQLFPSWKKRLKGLTKSPANLWAVHLLNHRAFILMWRTYRKSSCRDRSRVSLNSHWTQTLEEPVLDSTIINSPQEDLGPLPPLDLSVTWSSWCWREEMMSLKHECRR